MVVVALTEVRYDLATPGVNASKLAVVGSDRPMTDSTGLAVPTVTGTSMLLTL